MTPLFFHIHPLNSRQVVPKAVVDKIAKGGDIKAFDNGSESDGIVHKKGEWSCRAQWWVKHTRNGSVYVY